MGRQRVGLRPPRAGEAELVPFTGRRRALWRACDRRHRAPWWYASRTDSPQPGRFDLADPRGTCYWALSPVAAIIEKTTDPDQLDPPVISVTALAGLLVWRAERVPQARARLADTTVASVPKLTAELSTCVPYDVPWSWADAFDARGLNGILYVARFALDESVALFGDRGVPVAAPAAEPTTALDHYDMLPPGFRSAVGSIGTLDDLDRAPPP